jgi:hypothetical protein
VLHDKQNASKMKTAILFLLLILAEYLHAADPKFYIMLSANNKTAASYLKYFESQFSIGLKNKLPCASYLSQSDVVAMLEWEKQKQLLGVGDINQLSNIAEAMKCDYLVHLRIRVFENTTMIDAFIVKKGQDKVITRIAESAPGGDASLDGIEKVSKKLIDDLYQYNSQLCHEKTWSGMITVEEHTNAKIPHEDPRRPGATQKSDLSVNCVVNNNIAQCTVNYFYQLTGAEGSGTDVASGTYQTDVSISVLDGKTSISLGMVQAKGTSTSSLGGSSYSSEVVIPLGGWTVNAAIGTSTQSNSSSGSVKQGDLTITWSLIKK